MPSEQPPDYPRSAPASDEPTAYHQLIQDALQRLERASLAEVAATQLGALERILRHARATTPFYFDRLAPLFSDGTFTPQTWSSIAILTRDEASRNVAALRSSRLPEAVVAREGVTSGSSGTPLKFAWNPLASVSTRSIVERTVVWHDLDPSAPLAEIRSFPESPAPFPGRRMKRSWSFRSPETPFYRLSVTTPVAQQIGWLKLVGARYLLTYPTMARELAHAAMESGADLRFEAVLTVGEILTPEIRERCRDAFGAKVIDSYGCQEMGKIAIECEVSGHYHVCASNVFLEILDDDDAQVAPGGIGRIVLTSLYNYATPFIRYEIGDYGRLGGRCPCGRSLPVITEVFGRRRNMITLPGGDRLWLPGKSLAAMATHVPSKRMRLVQTALDAFDLLYVPREGAGEPNHAELQASATRLIHRAVRIRAVGVEDLSRAEGGKYEDVVGLV